MVALVTLRPEFASLLQSPLFSTRLTRHVCRTGDLCFQRSIRLVLCNRTGACCSETIPLLTSMDLRCLPSLRHAGLGRDIVYKTVFCLQISQDRQIELYRLIHWSRVERRVQVGIFIKSAETSVSNIKSSSSAHKAFGCPNAIFPGPSAFMLLWATSAIGRADIHSSISVLEATQRESA